MNLRNGFYKNKKETILIEEQLLTVNHSKNIFKFTFSKNNVFL